jgi:hypothetical protein
MNGFERRRRLIRVGLWYMAISTGLVSAWILLAPRNFYDEFPTGPAEWVSALPPYNEHLIRDYGAAGLGLGVLAALAAVWMERRLVQAAAIALVVGAAPHLVYHLTTTEAYSTGDNVASLFALAAQLAVPLAILALSRRPHGAAVPSSGAPEGITPESVPKEA